MYNKEEVLQKVDVLYNMWESALNTYNDKKTNFVFNPKICLERTFEEVQYALVKYKIALQKQKQTEIWLSLCKTFVELYNGDIRKLFDSLDNDVDKIINFIQKENKKKFPYLSGTKICNYWLYVIYQYTDRKYKNIERLTVAPDTHVIQATHKLGLITDEELNKTDVLFATTNPAKIKKYADKLKEKNISINY